MTTTSVYVCGVHTKIILRPIPENDVLFKKQLGLGLHHQHLNIQKRVLLQIIDHLCNILSL